MPNLGYLETDYATIQYGGGVAEKLFGSQFEALVTKDDVVGLQFEGTTTTEKVFSSQLEAIINATNALNSQFDSIVIDFQDGLNTQLQAANDDGKIAGAQFYKTPIKAVSIGRYLQDDNYATYSYLSPVFAKCMGTQFFAFNTKDKNLGVQFEGEITEDKNLFTQFEGVITKDDILNSQFLAVNTKDKSLPAQFEGFITKDKAAGGQFQGFITTELDLGGQFESFIIKTLNTQFRAVIYNTTQLRFLYDFPSRGINGLNWVASSTATSSSDAFSVYNLNTDIVEQAWRSGPGGVQNITCDTQDTGGVFLDTLAILEHNITRGATVLLVGSNDNFITTPFSEFLTVEDRNMYYISEDLPLQSYRYWQIQIVDPANPDGYIQIGTVVFGSSVVFSSEENITEEVDFGITQYADTIFTEGFTNISNDRGQKRQLGFKFKNLEAQSRNFVELRRMFEAVGNIQKVLWIPTPQDPSEFAVFAKMREVPRERHKQMGKHYVSLDINTDESL